MMETTEKKRLEREVLDKVTPLFEGSLKSVDFGYFKNSKAVLLTYTDFKSTDELKGAVAAVLGDEWTLVLKHEFSDASIALAMLKMYQENRVSVCHTEDGDVRCDPVRIYVNGLLERQ